MLLVYYFYFAVFIELLVASGHFLGWDIEFVKIIDFGYDETLSKKNLKSLQS